MSLSDAEKSKRYRENNRARVAAQQAARQADPKNKKATAARVRDLRLRKKLANCLTILDEWPHCHWKLLTLTPCRRKPNWIHVSTPLCDEHAKSILKIHHEKCPMKIEPYEAPPKS
tara:strand:+ start:577 stop:924 length:348 start_codon:yes stop_codon:yes gene_type:complete